MNNGVINTIPQILKDNICTIFNLLNFLIAISLAMVGAWKNILFIFIIVINTTIGIIQEIKAKKQIERLTLMSASMIKITRNGKELNIMPEEIEKGDILFLESGSAVCSDCKIISGTAEINESVLTGESEPVLKGSDDTLLSGSYVVSGKCLAKVTCDGAESFTSKILNEVKSTKHSGSEMILSMKKVTRFTAFFIVPLGILMFAQGYFFRGSTLVDTVTSTSAGLLGMLPKGLVLLISIGFATGVLRLSKKNVLVRELHSLENLAHCDVVCLDKTGTLTEGILSVESVRSYIDKNEFEKLISSYLKYTDDNNSTHQALSKHFECGESYGFICATPFSSERKFSAVTLDNGKNLILGAPEIICKEVPKDAEKLIQQGKRVLSVGLSNENALLDNIKLIGMIVISDNVRENAPETINYLYSQGIDVKVISGDNPIAASVVAKEAGIKNFDLYIDMTDVSDDEIKRIVENHTVFGRVTPKQKKLLISAMQEKGHKVAMTGDGVNDLLAMRRADCSVAIGTGCDAAKQTAQLVLINSDFSVLKDVISEGRRVINNITKSAGVFFIKTIYSVLLCMLCLVFNTDFPFIPIQITLIDAVIEGFPAFFMSFEKNENKCEKSFLETAIKNALPNGLAVFACCLILIIASEYLRIDKSQISLLMYISLGFISIAGVIKASLPFNGLRGFLAVSSCIGFICAVALFSNLLQLPKLSPLGGVILPLITVLGLMLTIFIKIPTDKISAFCKKI